MPVLLGYTCLQGQVRISSEIMSLKENKDINIVNRNAEALKAYVVYKIYSQTTESLRTNFRDPQPFGCSESALKMVQ